MSEKLEIKLGIDLYHGRERVFAEVGNRSTIILHEGNIVGAKDALYVGMGKSLARQVAQEEVNFPPSEDITWTLRDPNSAVSLAVSKSKLVEEGFRIERARYE